MKNTVSSLGRRITAYFIDIIPIIIITFIITYLIGFHDVIKLYFRNLNSKEYHSDFVFWRNRIRDISFIIYCIYATFLESSKFKGTFGKYIMKIEVVKNDGSKMTLLDSVKRNLFKIISYYPFGLGYMWTIVNKNRYAWHDYFAQTTVIKKSPLVEQEVQNNESDTTVL